MFCKFSTNFGKALMDSYLCQICQRDFSSKSGLTQHQKAKHWGNSKLKLTFQSPELSKRNNLNPPTHDEDLWKMPIINPTNEVSRQNFSIFQTSTSHQRFAEDIEALSNEQFKSQDHTTFFEELYSTKGESDTEIVEENSPAQYILPIGKNFECLPEDLEGVTYEEALESIEGKKKCETTVKWPNDAYHDFMELVSKGNLSNKIGDRIIKFFNKYSGLEKSPLPKSTKNGKDFLNQIQSTSLNFKEVILTDSGINITFYYRPIFRAIQTLLQRPGITDHFVLTGGLRKEKVC
jgi:hypothetical protein